jgi:PadR family transcriptional regulator
VTKAASNGNDSRWESQLRKGSLDLAILAILWERRCYGLEIIRELRANGGVELAEGTLYPILMRLTEESLLESTWVEAESGHPRKYYRLTKDGQRRAIEMIQAWDSFTGAMSNLTSPIRRSLNDGNTKRRGR